MKETITLYDAVLEFESTVFVSAFDKEFEAMLSHIPGCPDSVGQRHTLSHIIKAANLPIIPDDDFIEKYRQTIFDTVKEAFENDAKMNATVENTRFVGIKSLKTKTIEGEKE